MRSEGVVEQVADQMAHQDGITADGDRPRGEVEADLLLSEPVAATLVIGTHAGLYPAVRAARISPTFALHAA
ncbi:hypothetical protein ACFWIW_26620 [Amycolatopsis sp. NPDC058340]|uniref:hypothetical protein n=1 Tax=Amycolatopsis sp. NPDC058340 TaxID=3346453 RepID=UPI003651F3F0